MSIRVPSIRLVVLLFVLRGAAFGQATNDVAGPAATALRARQFEKALQLLQPALQASPKNPQLWMFEGLAYSGIGNRNSALASYQAALKIAPNYLPALEGAAQLEYEAGDPGARTLLEHVLTLRPNDPTSHAMLAVLAEKNGDCAGAVAHFSQSEPVLDSQPSALWGYGICLMRLNETDSAIQVLEKLVKSYPGDARARRGLAAAELKAGKTQDAIATLQPLLDSVPDVNTMRLAAAIYEANKDTPSAVKMLRDAIVKDPLGTALYVDFAEVAMDHQSFQTGVEMIDAGLRLQPGAAPLYLARGVLYVQLADYQKAEADFEKAEQLDPAQEMSGAAQSLLAEEQNQNDPDRALATVEAKLAKTPGDGFLWYLKAAILSQKAAPPGSAEFNQGFDAAKRAVSLQPSLTAAHNVLAKYYLDAGQNELAAKECRQALQQSPEDQTALYHLVLALRKTNNQAEIPDLLKRLAKARRDATKAEGERNRYKLVIAPSGPSE